jgi:hypothetical protein
MTRSIIKIAFICLLFFGRQAPAQVYEVTFLGLPVVYVRLEKTELNPDNHVSFQFKAETTPFFSRIFLVQNEYRLIMDSDLTGILSFEKNIIQKNIRQNLTTRYEEKKISYSNGEWRPADGAVHNMLSLILALTKENVPVTKHYSLEIEGEFYDATAVPMLRDDGMIQWEIKTRKTGGRPVLKETDLFTSRLGDPAAFRSITVDQKSQKILEANFSVSRNKLSAKIADN